MTQKRAVEILMGCAGMSRNEATAALAGMEEMRRVMGLPDMNKKDMCEWLIAIRAFCTEEPLRIQDVKGIDPGRVRWLLCDIRWKYKEMCKGEV